MFAQNVFTPKYYLRRVFRPALVRDYGVTLDVSAPEISGWIRDAIYKGFYERDERLIAPRLFGPGDRIIELGGGLGALSCTLARLVGDDALVVYEPNPALHPLIRRTFALNGVSPTLYGEALVSDPEVTSLTLQVGAHFWNASTTPEAAPSGADAVTVATRPLNDVVESRGANALVIDIEGGEYDLLHGVAAPAGLRKIMMEIHPHKIGEEKIAALEAGLAAQGFHLAHKGDGLTRAWVRE